MKIKFSGLPLQRLDSWANAVDETVGKRWGWNPFSVKGMGRYGGGWSFKLGITVSGSLRDWVISFGLGEVRISWEKK